MSIQYEALSNAENYSHVGIFLICFHKMWIKVALAGASITNSSMKKWLSPVLSQASSTTPLTTNQTGPLACSNSSTAWRSSIQTASTTISCTRHDLHSLFQTDSRLSLSLRVRIFIFLKNAHLRSWSFTKHTLGNSAWKSAERRASWNFVNAFRRIYQRLMDSQFVHSKNTRPASRRISHFSILQCATSKIDRSKL